MTSTDYKDGNTAPHSPEITNDILLNYDLSNLEFVHSNLKYLIENRKDLKVRIAWAKIAYDNNSNSFIDSRAGIMAFFVNALTMLISMIAIMFTSIPIIAPTHLVRAPLDYIVIILSENSELSFFIFGTLFLSSFAAHIFVFILPGFYKIRKFNDVRFGATPSSQSHETSQVTEQIISAYVHQCSQLIENRKLLKRYQ